MINEINIGDINVELDLSPIQVGLLENSSRYIAPKQSPTIPYECLMYSHAQDLVKKILLSKKDSYFVIVGGSFVFGDFIEAFITEKNLKVYDLTISTLSLGKHNVDSLANLLHGNFVDKLNIIVSHFFYAHEKNKTVPYMLKELDFNKQLDLGVTRCHTKMVLMDTNKGKIVMHGSANLRSSDNFEQLQIDLNENLYNFAKQFHDEQFKNYSIIKKDDSTRR